MAIETDMFIIDAGCSGLAIAHEARRRGNSDIFLLERVGDIRGVWRENSCPDVACDISSHFFYSMATHLEANGRYTTLWSVTFSEFRQRMAQSGCSNTNKFLK